MGNGKTSDDQASSVSLAATVRTSGGGQGDSSSWSGDTLPNRHLLSSGLRTEDVTHFLTLCLERPFRVGTQGQGQSVAFATWGGHSNVIPLGKVHL
jgi:hypothetical protein